MAQKTSALAHRTLATDGIYGCGAEKAGGKVRVCEQSKLLVKTKVISLCTYREEESNYLSFSVKSIFATTTTTAAPAYKVCVW